MGGGKNESPILILNGNDGIHIYIHNYIHIIHTYIHVQCTYIHTYTYVYMYIHVNVPIFVPGITGRNIYCRSGTATNTVLNNNMYIYMCMYVCMYIYICMYVCYFST